MQSEQVKASVQMQIAQMREETARYVAELNAQAAQQREELKADATHDVEELKGMVQLLLQKMQPPPMLVQAVAEDISEEGPMD